MVKCLGRYVNKVCYFNYGDQGFESKIISDTDDKGNKRYFITLPNGEEIRIFSRGEDRVRMRTGGILEIRLIYKEFRNS
jgi:hypothetical protein